MSASPSVWSDLVGQSHATATLQRAVSGQRHAMTHAWLITGPPGSGRSNAARAFAAALQCDKGGCGVCQACTTALSGAHPDVTLVRTEKLSIGIDEIKDLVRRAAMAPTLGRAQVLVVEDADRVTERGADALLKAIEEPAAKTVWLLCAPNPEDVVRTIRSRCRLLTLTTPTTNDVFRVLTERDGVDGAMAGFAARASHGHIGRARALARDEKARLARHELMKLPGRLTSVGNCLELAAKVVSDAKESTDRVASSLEAKELAEFEQALGYGTKGARPQQATAAKRDLEDQHKARRTRLNRDAIDRTLAELTGFYRDVMHLQIADGSDLVNGEDIHELRQVAAHSTPEQTVGKIDAIIECRWQLEGNVPPQLALESLFVTLGRLNNR